MLPVLNNFMNNRFELKSRDCKSALSDKVVIVLAERWRVCRRGRVPVGDCQGPAGSNVTCTSTHTHTHAPLQYLHRVPKKLSRFVFVRTCQISTNSILFGRKMGNDPNVCEVHSFSTSPNLRHHLTVLNVNVPNCYVTPNVVICNKLLTT